MPVGVLSLAWRNLWRQRRRSLTSLGAVALVVCLSLLYYSIGGAAVNSMYRNLTEAGGQVQVHVQGYRDLRDFSDGLIRDASQVEATVRAQAGSGVVVGVLDVPGLLIHGDRSRAVALSGRDWPAALQATYLRQNPLEGTFVRSGDDTGIVLGRGLATALDVGIGDEVVMYAPGTEGFGAGSYTVTGLVDVLDPSAASRTALVSLAAAQSLAAQDAVSHIEVHFPDIRRLQDNAVTSAVAERVQGALPGLSVESWRELSPTLVRILDSLRPVMAIVSVIFFVLAGLLVVNSIYLGMVERIREFGVLMSLGASGRRVMGLITLESVLLCAAGAAVGVAIGLPLVGLMARGFTIPGLEQYYASFGMDPMFYASIQPGEIAFAILFALATGVLAALWPASIASRLEPVEAMRFTA
ncbi:MAG: FtsX-like permease family protein [Deinococcales bacterium]